MDFGGHARCARFRLSLVAIRPKVWIVLVLRVTFLRLEIKRGLSIADPGGEPTVVSDPLSFTSM